MSAAALEQEKTVSLKTFKKDGTGVATPIWFLRDGDQLLMTTQAESWKIKRIRNDPKVELTPCNGRGKIKDGAPTYTGTARIDDGADAVRTRKRVFGRYGITAKIISFFQKLTRHDDGNYATIVVSFE